VRKPAFLFATAAVAWGAGTVAFALISAASVGLLLTPLTLLVALSAATVETR
jgi:hypothetical protein